MKFILDLIIIIKYFFQKGFGLPRPTCIVQLAQRGVVRDQAIHQNDRNPKAYQILKKNSRKLMRSKS